MKKWMAAFVFMAAVILSAMGGFQAGWQKGSGYFIVEDALVHADTDLWILESLRKADRAAALKAVETDLRDMDATLRYVGKPAPRRLAPAVAKVLAAIQAYKK